MSFFAELKRRNVVRVGIAYGLIAWVALQIIDFLLELTDAPSWVLQVCFILAAIGLPIVLIFSWIFEMTPEGIKRESEVDRSASITPTTAPQAGPGDRAAGRAGRGLPAGGSPVAG